MRCFTGRQKINHGFATRLNSLEADVRMEIHGEGEERCKDQADLKGQMGMLAMRLAALEAREARAAIAESTPPVAQRCCGWTAIYIVFGGVPEQMTETGRTDLVSHILTAEHVAVGGSLEAFHPGQEHDHQGALQFAGNSRSGSSPAQMVASQELHSRDGCGAQTRPPGTMPMSNGWSGS